jgi:hypothetical protein
MSISTGVTEKLIAVTGTDFVLRMIYPRGEGLKLPLDSKLAGHHSWSEYSNEENDTNA